MATSANLMTFSTEGINFDELPANLDWRKGNGSIQLVTPVENQGHCGSCWAFSAAGVLEAFHAKTSGKLVALSKQNLLDCDTDTFDEGCGGGKPKFALAYAEYHPLETEHDYPYVGSQGTCKYNSSKVKHDGRDPRKIVALPEGDEKALMAAVALHGPISIAYRTSKAMVNFVGNGIWHDDEGCSGELDHAMLLVGYGSDPTEGDYWIVKNSWGTPFGNEGYFRTPRNKDNYCGIATEAFFVM